MPKKNKNYKKSKTKRKTNFDSIAFLIKKMTSEKTVSIKKTKKESFSSSEEENLQEEDFNVKKTIKKKKPKILKKTISEIINKNYKLLDKRFSKKIHIHPYNVSNNKKGRFLQNVLKEENFESNFKGLFNYTENDIISIQMIERLREKIDANIYNTQIIDFDIDDVNLIIHDFENFEMNFNKFFRLFSEIKRIIDQIFKNLICEKLKKVLENVKILEEKSLSVIIGINSYKENIGIFLKFLSRKLEFDYYLIKNPEVLNDKFHYFLNALVKKRIYFLKMYEKIKKKLLFIKSYQFYGLQLKRGKIIRNNKKLNIDFDEEVLEKNYQFLQNRIDLKKSENKDFLYFSNFQKYSEQKEDLEIYSKYNKHFNKLQKNAINIMKKDYNFKKIEKSPKKNDFYNEIFDYKNKNSSSDNYFDLYKEMKKQIKGEKKNFYQNFDDDFNYNYENKKSKGLFFLSDHRVLQEINFQQNKNLEKTKKKYF